MKKVVVALVVVALGVAAVAAYWFFGRKGDAASSQIAAPVADMPPIARPYALGTLISLSEDSEYLLPGWSHGESWGRWMAEPKAGLAFQLDEDASADDNTLTLNLARAYQGTTGKGQRIRILSGGTLLQEVVLTKDAPATLTVDIPAGTANSGGYLEIVVEAPDCVSPQSLGRSEDSRCLSIGAMDALLEKR